MDTVHKFDFVAELQAGQLAQEHSAKVDPYIHASSVPAYVGGKVYGKCPRLAWLRWNGHSEAATLDRLIMFAGGRANEVMIKAELEAARRKFLQEEEVGCAISWTAEGGVRVAGRPDLLLIRRDDSRRPEYGVELKRPSSLWNAVGVNFDLRPKSDHLVQAAHYSWQHGMLPWVLHYRNDVEWHLPMQAPKWLREKFTPGCPDIQFKDDRAFKILPFDRAYRLGWTGSGDEARFQYWTEGMDRPVVTRITPAAIRAGAKLITQIGEESTGCGPRPGKVAVDGSDTYLPCDYCELAETCDSYEKSFLQWRDRAIVALNELSASRRPSKESE